MLGAAPTFRLCSLCYVLLEFNPVSSLMSITYYSKCYINNDKAKDIPQKSKLCSVL